MEDKTEHLEKGTKAFNQSMEEYRQELLKDGWKEDQQGFKSLMALHEHLVATPIEQLEKEWAEVEEATKEMEGPTVKEYFESLNPQAMYAKGYREGALRYKGLVEEFLKNWVAQIKERDAERHKEDNELYERKLAEAREKNPDTKFVFVSPGISMKEISYHPRPIEDIIEHYILPELQNIYDNN